MPVTRPVIGLLSYNSQTSVARVPDGTSNATLTLPLTCSPQCSATCTPTTCAAQGKNCGPISDGCNMVLDCGTCHPPLRCGAVTPNVCGR